MQYPTLTIEEGRSCLERLRTGQSANPPATTWRGAGPARFDAERVDLLAESFRSIRKRFTPESGEEAKVPWARIEGLLAAEVHDTLRAVPKFALSDPQFWIWTVFGSQNDFPAKAVNIRHGHGLHGYDALPENYNLSNSLEAGFWSRVWMRGEIGYDPTREDPYELATRGDQDFWRSHLLRQEFSSVRTVAHALILFQFPDERPDKPTVDTRTIRAMVKEIRRKHATIAYEFLDAEGARLLIEEVHASLPSQ